MWFISLAKFKRRPTRAEADEVTKYWKEAEKWHPGFKVHHSFWTLGEYDAVVISEAKDENEVMQVLMWLPGDFAHTQTMTAVSRDQAVQWLK